MVRKLITTAGLATVLALGCAGAQAQIEVAVGSGEIFIGGSFYGTGFGRSTDADSTSSYPAGFYGEDFDVEFDGEVTFRFEQTLDNGLTFGGNIDLEADAEDRASQDDNLDEAAVFIRGDFGTIVIGATDSAGYDTAIGAPSLGIGFGPEDTAELSSLFGSENNVGEFFRSTLGSTRIENGFNNEPIRVTYFTPRFSGFQLGLSYAHNETRDGNYDDCYYSKCNFVDIGAAYNKDFGDFTLAASARYGFADGPGSSSNIDPEVFGFGTQIGFGGFTIGGSFAEQNGGTQRDGQSFDVGASYDTGPWTFTLNHFHGDRPSDYSSSGYTSSNTIENDTFGLAIDYKLAKGVRLNAYGAYQDFDQESTYGYSGSTTTNSNEISGFVIGSGIGLSF